MEPQGAEERAGEEMTLVLLSLMEHYGASVGLTCHTDITTGAVGKESRFPVQSSCKNKGVKKKMELVLEKKHSMLVYYNFS